MFDAVYNNEYMGRYIQQNESRSELQQRLAAELREKAAKRASDEGSADPYSKIPNGIEDSEYIRGTKQTTGLALVWLGVFVFIVIAFVVFVIR